MATTIPSRSGMPRSGTAVFRIRVYGSRRAIMKYLKMSATNATLLAGFVAAMDLAENPTVFYAAHPSFRSRGYMKECMQEVILYLRETCKCSFVQTEVYEENVASISLLTSCGFDVIDKIDDKIFLKYEMSSLRR